MRRSTVTKNLQARIASRWVLEADKQLLASRIEFFGASNTDLLELELPSGFTVEEVTNRNAKVKVNEREESGISLRAISRGKNQLGKLRFFHSVEKAGTPYRDQYGLFLGWEYLAPRLWNNR